MGRYEDFKAADTEVTVLVEWLTRPNGDEPVVKFLVPLAEARVQALRAIFDDPAPVPVEPVKPKAKRGDVDGAVRNALGSEITDYPARDWTEWAKANGFNRKSVLAAVRRHTEKNKT
jgi:hypothetical protein